MENGHQKTGEVLKKGRGKHDGTWFIDAIRI